MRELICTVCPNGCRISVEENTLEVYNNKCKRGKEFGINEVTNPKRSLTSTVKTTFDSFPVVSVRTSKDIDKEKIFALMDCLSKVVITEKLDIGTVIIKNVLGTDVDIITTTPMK